MSQELAIEAIENGENVFITGSGGSGKSYTMRQVTDLCTALCAPTGVAALNIDGQTAHSLFGLPIGSPEPQDYLPSTSVKKLFSGSAVKRIILDEVGMMTSLQLDIINSKLMISRKNNKPFGGIQMIVVGDLYQLEPIVKWDEKKDFKNTTPYVFGAKAWNFRTIFLDKVFRQSDERQKKILESIRTGDHWSSLALKRVVDEATDYDPEEDILHICSHKADVRHINKYWYSKIEEDARSYEAIKEGDLRTKWESLAPVAQTVEYKIGAKALICANEPEPEGGERKYVNGDTGIITAMLDYGVVVKLDRNDTEIMIEPYTWKKERLVKKGRGMVKETLAEFTQYPILLGYAATVHKIQGCTLDKAVINIRDAFSSGLLYVALSRVRDLRDLRFAMEPKASDIKVSNEVHEFYKKEREKFNKWLEEKDHNESKED